MKVEEKKECRRLRRAGESIKVIASKIGVSPSSVSRWVKDIELTEEQKEDLIARNPAFNGQSAGAKANQQKSLRKRQRWQEEGRKLAKQEPFSLMLAGCMLYWAEGWKKNNRSSVAFVNSDADMLSLFVRFITECFFVSKEELSLAINCYTDIKSAEECENYWLERLNLPRICLRKTICDKRPACTKRKRNGILEFGTAKVMMHNTEIMQKIYGAIREFGGFASSKWD